MVMRIVWCWGSDDADLDEVMNRTIAEFPTATVLGKEKGWFDIERWRAIKDGNAYNETDLPSLTPPDDEREEVGVVILKL